MEISLHPNAWHRRFQKWTFSDPHMPKMQNLCPYFWLTVLCLFLAPIVAGWKVLRRPANWTLNVLGSLVDTGSNCYEYQTRRIKDLRYYNEVARYGKWTAALVGALLAGGLLVFWWWNHPSSLLMVVATLATIGLIVLGVYLLISRDVTMPGSDAIEKVLDLGVDGVVWFFSKVLRPFPLLWGYFMAVLNRMCPAINWQEPGT